MSRDLRRTPVIFFARLANTTRTGSYTPRPPACSYTAAAVAVAGEQTNRPHRPPGPRRLEWPLGPPPSSSERCCGTCADARIRRMGTHLSWGCRHRLSKIVTVDYVKQHGLTIKSGQEQLATIQVAGAIARSARRGRRACRLMMAPARLWRSSRSATPAAARRLIRTARPLSPPPSSLSLCSLAYSGSPECFMFRSRLSIEHRFDDSFAQPAA